MTEDQDLIHEHGYWINTNDSHHIYDSILCESIIYLFLDKVNSVVDVGCGNGAYVKTMRSAGMNCVGYDGNPNTEENTNGLCKVADFAEPVDIGEYDLTVCLEVGEHIPKQYEQIFIDNIVKCSKNWIVLSWGLPEQPGWGHVNCQYNEYIIDEFERRGVLYDVEKSIYLRETSEYWWFKNTILVFKKETK